MADLTKNEDELTKEIMDKIEDGRDKVNLKKHIVNLSKTVVNLSKKENIDLSGVKAKVVVALDYSRSMKSLYREGVVQYTLDRLIPLGLTFDDDGEVDVYLFQDSYCKMKTMNLGNYETYIKRVVEPSPYHMGGTKYSPVLEGIIYGGNRKEITEKKSIFGTKQKEVTVRDEPIVNDEQPTLIIFITDGENSDKMFTTDLLRKCSAKNVFIQFIGIGIFSFEYLERLDNIAGRVRDNTGFTKIESIKDCSDDELYNVVLEQFAKWLKGEQ